MTADPFCGQVVVQKSVASKWEDGYTTVVVVVALKTGADSKYINRLEVKVAFYIIKFAPSWQNSLSISQKKIIQISLFPRFFDPIDMRSVKNH